MQELRRKELELELCRQRLAESSSLPKVEKKEEAVEEDEHVRKMPLLTLAGRMLCPKSLLTLIPDSVNIMDLIL